MKKNVTNKFIVIHDINKQIYICFDLSNECLCLNAYLVYEKFFTALLLQ